MSVVDRTKHFLTEIRESAIGLRIVSLHLGLFALSALFLFPILLFFMNSVKSSSAIFTTPSYQFPTEITFSHYVEAWQSGFGRYMLNSVVVVGVSLILILGCSILAAYALVRFEFRGRFTITAIILAGFMIPTQILFIPRYVMMSWLRLLDTHLSLILVYASSGLPFAVFLLRQHFVGIPESLAEAARLDGCSDLQILYRIYLPLAVPAVSAVFIFQFVIIWNEFLYAFSFINTDSLQTLPAGLFDFQGAYGTDWARLMAGVAIAITPTMIMFLLFRNQFIRSVNMRAKG